MKKKWLCLILAVLMVASMIPFALAEEEAPVDEEPAVVTNDDPAPEANEDPAPAANEDPAPTTGEGEGEDPAPTTGEGEGEDPAPTTGEGESEDPTPGTGEGEGEDPTPGEGGEGGEDPTPGEGGEGGGTGSEPEEVVTTLTATGGTFPYDGLAHAVTYTLENGEGYKVRFSTDDGETWSTKAPSLTQPGSLTVKVEASKSGAETLTVQVKLEVTEATTEGETLTIVNCNSCNVRKKADSTSAKLGEAKKGKTFKLLGKKGNWYKIQYTSKQVGYVYYKYGEVDAQPEEEETEVTGDTVKIVNVKSKLNIRKKASSSSTRLGYAYNGDTFPYKGKSGNWIKITYKKKTAYVYYKYTKIIDSSEAEDPEEEDDIPEAGETGYIVNVNTSVNVRQKASSSSKKLGTLKLGAKVEVVGKKGDWVKITYKKGTKGVAYVYAKYVSSKKPGADVEGKDGTIYNCNTAVNVRAKASSSSKKLGTAKKGTVFTVLGVSGNWVKVDYEGQPAYIYKRYVKIG